MIDKYNCEPECFEALEDLGQKYPLTPSNLKDKRIYEARRFNALCDRFDAHRGNYGWFAQQFGDVDIGYGSFVNE